MQARLRKLALEVVVYKGLAASSLNVFPGSDLTWGLYPIQLLRSEMKFWKKEDRADRQALEATTPQTNKTVPWWKDDGLLKLNILLFFPLISQYVQGYDASLINNVQQLKVWQSGM